VVLGAVAASVTASTRSASTLTLNLRSRATARYAAESGVVAAIARLYDLLSRARTPEEQVLAFTQLDEEFGSLRDSDVGSGRFSVAVLDASSRIDLNRAPEETVRGLLAQFAGAGDAESLIAALQDWKDADGLRRPRGAEADDYRKAGSPFMPANGPLRRLDELTRVAGFTDPLVRVLAPYVTVDGDLKINANTAPEPVLAAIPAVGPAGARVLVASRRTGGFFRTPAALAEAMGGRMFGPMAYLQLDVLPTRLLIVSRGWQPGRPLTHEIQAAYELRGSNLLLRSWRERDL
jgi:general secretion pathway protein K